MEPSYFAKVKGRMKERLVREKPRKIWLACSGGLDSMVLMHTLAGMGPEVGEMEVLHVNFRLRGEESEEDASFVRESSQALGLKCQILQVERQSHPVDQRGVQEWARELRYGWFDSLMQKGDYLALAHHADDLVETILMRIARGAHLTQLLAMEEMRGNRWRPFIELPREIIQNEAVQQKIIHREDSSNAKLVYTRNVIRHRILPELEALYPGIRQSLSQLAQDALDFTRFSEETEKSSIAPTSVALRQLPGAVARQKIRSFLEASTGKKGLSRQVLEQLRLALVEGRELSMNLNEKLRVLVSAGSIQVLAAHRQRSMRWSQYSKGLVDLEPCLCLTSSSKFVLMKRLE